MPAATSRPRAGDRGRADPRSAGRWIGLTVALVILAILVASLGVVLATSRRNVTTAADDTVRRIGERTADLVVSHLDVATSSLDQIDALATDARLSERSDEVDRILAAQLVAHPQLSGAFIGFPDGDFVFAYRESDELMLRRISNSAGGRRAIDQLLGPDLAPTNTFVIETDYDPRDRPWYSAASDDGGAIWTDPYVFFRSGAPGVTLARARRDAGEVEAVVGVDISLEELSAFLDDLPIDEGAEAFLDAGTTIVAAPASHELAALDGTDELPTVEDIGVSFDQLHAVIRSGLPVDVGDGGRIHLIDLPGADAPAWSVLIRTEEAGFVAALDRQARIAFVAILFAGLVLLLATPLLTRWLRRPIDDLRQLARFDALTDVTNRGTFLAEAEAALDAARRQSVPFVIALVDVDDFKEVNDRHGHAVGDEVLRRIGESINANVRHGDLVGRLGGDELAIALCETGRHEAEPVLERVRHAVVESGTEFGIGVTIGAAASNGRELTLAELMVEADHELLVAKQTGNKGGVHWSEGGPVDPTPLRFRLE